MNVKDIQNTMKEMEKNKASVKGLVVLNNVEYSVDCPAIVFTKGNEKYVTFVLR
jgi:hypothetical protein